MLVKRQPRLRFEAQSRLFAQYTVLLCAMNHLVSLSMLEKRVVPLVQQYGFDD